MEFFYLCLKDRLNEKTFKCIAKWLEKVLPMLIDRDQTGYVKIFG